MDYKFENQEHMWAEVQNMLDSPGWMGYIAPSLMEVLKADTDALIAPKRGLIPDDFLRGRISLAHSLLHLLPAKVEEFKNKQGQLDLFGPDGQPISDAGDPYADNAGEGQPSAN